MDTKTKKTPKSKPAKKTPKQAMQRIQSLLKGLDNSVVIINKHKVAVNDAVKEMRSLMGGLSNMQAAAPKPSPKPAPAKPGKPEAKKPAPKKPAPKKPAPAKKAAASAKKPAPAKKPEAKKAAASAKKPAPAKPGKPVDGRPSLKEAVRQVIAANGGMMTAADIWKQATTKWGYWSRQSLYNVLKDEKVFSRQGEKVVLAKSDMVNDAEAEQFVQQVESNVAVSNVQ